MNMELGPKRFELMRQLLPDAASIALVVNPNNPRVAEVQTRDAQEATRSLGLQLQILQASTPAEFEMVAAGLSKRSVGLVIGWAAIRFSSAKVRHSPQSLCGTLYQRLFSVVSSRPPED